MYYPILKTQLDNLLRASESDVNALDEYLGELPEAGRGKISPWRVSKKTSIDQIKIYEVFSVATSLGILEPIYQLWCPETRVTIATSSKRDDFSVNSGDECPSCHHTHEFNDSDIYLSFKLIKKSETQNLEAKKKVLNLPIRKSKLRLNLLST